MDTYKGFTSSWVFIFPYFFWEGNREYIQGVLMLVKDALGSYGSWCWTGIEQELQSLDVYM